MAYALRKFSVVSLGSLTNKLENAKIVDLDAKHVSLAIYVIYVKTLFY